MSATRSAARLAARAVRERREDDDYAVARLSLEQIFGAEGPLAAGLSGYEARPEQLEVATAIDHAMRTGQPCLTEAGTGVGKTFAYLIPAIRAALAGKRTVISTHTISLQNQLIEKDIPLVLSLFPEVKPKVRATLMKGRGNFLCKQDYQNARADLFLSSDRQFREIGRWQQAPDCTGDVADLPFSYPAWYEIAANQDTCRGQECFYYDNCFYYRMRWKAAESNLIVVNHALFLSDLMVRISEPNGIIPDYQHVVFDEAHHLEEVATKAFGIEFSSRRLTDLVERIKHVRGLDLDRARLAAIEEMNESLFAPYLQATRQEFFMDDIVREEEARHAAQERCSATCNSLSELQNVLLQIGKDDEQMRERMEGLSRMCGRAREELAQLFKPEPENAIRWGNLSQWGRADTRRQISTLHLTPISVAERLKSALWDRMELRKGSVVLTSATLANSGGFDYARTRLGVPEQAIECLVGSPFDYKRQAMLYVPAHLPPPPKAASPAYTAMLIDEIERVVTLTEGRAFLLFTSRATLNTAHEQLKERLPYPLFKQGDQPPRKLVEAFRESGNGILMGVQTFWEGVDVQGDALSCVIIDRLPFAVPDSPVTQARTQAITEAGGDWFREFSMPQAQIRLKQGFGRLIRTKTDRGIVCILDSRLISRDYGAEFVKYLPPAARASKWSRVQKWWEAGYE